MPNPVNKLSESEDVFTKRLTVALSLGYEYLGRLKYSLHIPENRWCDYGIYRKISCGHVHILCHRNVKEIKTDYCKTCTEESYMSLVKSLGMEFLGFSRKSKNGTMYVDVKLNCGHYKSIRTGNLKTGAFTCKVCLEERYKAICELFGFKYIKHVTSSYHEVELPCGCKETRHLTNIKNGGWSCPTHNKSSLDYSSNLYLLKMSCSDFSWLKLGYSRNVPNRIVAYDLADGITVEVLDIIKVHTGRSALKIEKSIHTKFKKSKLSSKEMKRYFKSSGFNECYPLEMLDTLLAELEKIRNG